MPSFDHEILVDLFRENAVLAAELLRSCAGIDIVHARADHGSIDLSQVVSTEYRAAGRAGRSSSATQASA